MQAAMAASAMMAPTILLFCTLRPLLGCDCAKVAGREYASNPISRRGAGTVTPRTSGCTSTSITSPPPPGPRDRRAGPGRGRGDCARRAGVDGITAHLRGRSPSHAGRRRRAAGAGDADRVQSRDGRDQRDGRRSRERLRPYQVTLGAGAARGGDDRGRPRMSGRAGAASRAVVRRLAGAGVRVSVFVDPDPAAVEASRRRWARRRSSSIPGATRRRGRRIDRPRAGPRRRPGCWPRRRGSDHRPRSRGPRRSRPHVRNVGPVASIPEIEELNIGHSIVSRAVFVGLAAAVQEMRVAMRCRPFVTLYETEHSTHVARWRAALRGAGPCA